MTLNTHGIKEGSKEDQPDEAKVKEREKAQEKAEEVEDTYRYFKPRRSKGQGLGRRKGRSHMVREKKNMKKIGKKKKKKTGMIPGMKAIGPMNKTGMMAIGPQKNCTTRMSMVISRGNERKERDEYGYFQRGKERKERKER